jgi:hypothetical protein
MASGQRTNGKKIKPKAFVCLAARVMELEQKEANAKLNYFYAIFGENNARFI